MKVLLKEDKHNMMENLLRKRKEKEFEKIIIKYTSYVATIVYNINSNLSAQDIEDITSNVFIAVWQKSIDYKKSNFKSYLAGMTRNITLNYLRCMKVTLNIDDEIILSNSNIDEDFERKELSNIVTKIVNSLSEPDKTIFIRYYWFNHDTRKISNDLHLNRNTIMSKLSRSREKLKKEILERGYSYEKI